MDVNMIDSQNSVYVGILCLLWNASAGCLDLFSQYLPRSFRSHSYFLKSQLPAVFAVKDVSPEEFFNMRASS